MNQVEKSEINVAVTFPSSTAPVLCNAFGVAIISEAIILDFGFINPSALKVLKKGTDDKPDLIEAVQVSRITISKNELEKIINTLQEVKKDLES